MLLRGAFGARGDAKTAAVRRLPAFDDTVDPILADDRRRPSPRRVSLRWLSGTTLTGITGALLVGGALQAPLAGFSLPQAALASKGDLQTGSIRRARKGDRPVLPRLQSRERVVQVPVVTREGASRVVRKMPFGYASAPLSVAFSGDYPPFDSLSLFARANKDRQQAGTHAIYDVDVETDLEVTLEPFSFDAPFHYAGSTPEAARASVLEHLPRSEATQGPPEVAATLDAPAIGSATLTALFAGAENVSLVEKSRDPVFDAGHSAESVVRLSAKRGLAEALARFDNRDVFSKVLADSAVGEAGGDGERLLRIAYREEAGAARRVERVSVYRDGEHVASFARDDGDRLVEGMAPATLPTISSRSDPWGGAGKKGLGSGVGAGGAALGGSLYDGVMRAALSQGLDVAQAGRLTRAFAFDVDYRASLKAGDSLEVFYSMTPGASGPDGESRVLYAALTTGGITRRLYAYAPDPDGDTLDWYDETGKSAKRFLLRQPVPAGRFTSGFGMRRHPIARYRKMHTGVDWAAPSGTKILSAGNGVVEKASWAGGYGRQIKIRHANGYVTSYSHLRSFAKGVRKGARVRQGQFIGRVGTSGASTGPHLHYEVIVNGRKVNPMRIRLPKGRTLKGPELAAFKRERNRIDDLVARAGGKVEVASR